MAKSWSQMTDEEKLEFIRDNYVSREQFEQLRKFTHRLEQGISEAYGRIDALEKKLAAPAA